MPTITDVTVVNQAYDTSGNGGRRLVRLSNGWLVSVVFTGIEGTASAYHYFYISKDNGATWSQLCYLNNINTNMWYRNTIAIVAVGTKVYGIVGRYNGLYAGFYSFVIDATTQTNVNIDSTVTAVDPTQTNWGGCSISANSAGTELHVAWASKNSTYPNSFNIRYAKGTINADGSVTWGSVTQVSTNNVSGLDAKNPSIVLANGNPVILADENSGTASNCILAYRYNGTGFSRIIVYNGTGYTQAYPSACVDKNGRIWVVWHGTDSTDTTATNIRVAYSDDGGQTWSSMQKLTSGSTNSQGFPTVTVNKSNEVFVIWHGSDPSDSFTDIRMIKYNGTWNGVNVITAGITGAKSYPSSLCDPTLDFSTPLFIYKDQQGNKVGFYGTWIITTISPTEGNIGQKTSRNNLFTFSITTDGSMSPISVSINGTNVYSNSNPQSGTQYTINLSQAQWDAIKYGNGHTIVITMGDDSWTYTFDKRLNANDDILSAVKGVQNLQTHLNGIKAQLGAAIRAKGGTVNDTDTWSAFVSAVSNMANKRWASGTFYLSGGANAISVSGLSFAPNFVIAWSASSPSSYVSYAARLDSVITNVFKEGSYVYLGTVTLSLDSFLIQIANGTGPNGNFKWLAIE